MYPFPGREDRALILGPEVPMPPHNSNVKIIYVYRTKWMRPLKDLGDQVFAYKPVLYFGWTRSKRSLFWYNLHPPSLLQGMWKFEMAYTTIPLNGLDCSKNCRMVIIFVEKQSSMQDLIHAAFDDKAMVHGHISHGVTRIRSINLSALPREMKPKNRDQIPIDRPHRFFKQICMCILPQ